MSRCGLPEFLGAFSDCTSCSLVAVFRHPSVHGVFDFGLLYRFEIATKISKAQVYQKVVPPVGCVPAAFGGHVPGNRSDWAGIIGIIFSMSARQTSRRRLGIEFTVFPHLKVTKRPVLLQRSATFRPPKLIGNNYVYTRVFVIDDQLVRAVTNQASVRAFANRHLGAIGRFARRL